MECDDEDAERMVHGPWAGDKFDVTLYSLHEHKNDPAWRDITNDVLVFLKRLAKKNHYDSKRFRERKQKESKTQRPLN
ncbi:hypothetical protein BDP27DRAFT_1331198 [Rhodocollybia butyracea]|uniref:Uncharacterized protein n=1 Tax=Rhodocollybia butyracea TaxID=206335 RepID=A0A9P5PQG4_9AGAR|nr:hypothetical protein BDP27DRAFT_1331198 [Rhodocollybia butyracea]